MNSGFQSGSHKQSPFLRIHFAIFHFVSPFANIFLSHGHSQDVVCFFVDAKKLCVHVVSLPSENSEYFSMNASSFSEPLKL